MKYIVFATSIINKYDKQTYNKHVSREGALILLS